MPEHDDCPSCGTSNPNPPTPPAPSASGHASRMGAIDFAAVKAEHEGEHWCTDHRAANCLTYRLAKAASDLAAQSEARLNALIDVRRKRDDLAGKVARVEALRHETGHPAWEDLDAALADQPEQVQPTAPVADPGRPAVGVCSRKDCGRPWSEHEHGMFCP